MRLLAPLTVEILAGYVGGSAKTLAFYPLDTLTTLREVGAKRVRRPLASLYAGLGMTVLGMAPYAVIFHTALFICELLLSSFELPRALVKLCASTCGAVAAALVGVPFECLKHRVQLGVAAYKTPQLALTATLRSDGLRGLYAGLTSTLARNVPCALALPNAYTPRVRGGGVRESRAEKRCNPTMSRAP